MEPAGSVNFKTPDTELYFVENYGKNADAKRDAGAEPGYVYLGRLVGTAQRGVIKQFSLKTRKLIGNTVRAC